MSDAPYTCIYCNAPSWVDPYDQRRNGPPPDYCHGRDHEGDDVQEDAP